MIHHGKNMNVASVVAALNKKTHKPKPASGKYRPYTADDARAFKKRVEKRRSKKGYK